MDNGKKDETIFCCAGEGAVDIDDAEDEKAGIEDDVDVLFDDGGTIKFRVGDIVKYDDKYCVIIKIYQYRDDSDCEVYDRFRLKYIELDADPEPFDHDYANDRSMILIKKNLFFIKTTVCVRSV